MQEITSHGYQDFRNYVQANWTYIELRRTNGTPVLRLPVSDPRVSWNHAPGAQELELVAIITAIDADIQAIGLPIVFGESAVFTQTEGGNARSVVTFPDFNMAQADPAEPDKLTVRHRIQIPQIA